MIPKTLYLSSIFIFRCLADVPHGDRLIWTVNTGDACKGEGVVAKISDYVEPKSDGPCHNFDGGFKGAAILQNTEKCDVHVYKKRDCDSAEGNGIYIDQDCGATCADDCPWYSAKVHCYSGTDL